MRHAFPVRERLIVLHRSPRRMTKNDLRAPCLGCLLQDIQRPSTLTCLIVIRRTAAHSSALPGERPSSLTLLENLQQHGTVSELQLIELSAAWFSFHPETIVPEPSCDDPQRGRSDPPETMREFAIAFPFISRTAASGLYRNSAHTFVRRSKCFRPVARRPLSSGQSLDGLRAGIPTLKLRRSSVMHGTLAMENSRPADNTSREMEWGQSITIE